VRPAPDGGILLVENPTDTPVEARLRLPRTVQAAWHESLSGQPMGELDIDDNEILVTIPPFRLRRIGFIWSMQP
jgi:hypothetical protein